MTSPDTGVHVSTSLDGRGHGWRPIVVYVVISMVGAWLVALPLWFTGGLASPLFGLLVGAMMFTPTLAAVVATRWGERRRFRTHDGRPGVFRSLGLVPSKPLRRWFGWLGLAYLVILGIVVIAYALSAALGLWVPDLVNFSLFREVLDAAGHPKDASITMLVILQLVQYATVIVAVNCLATAGEEIGWRGYLYPRLLDRLPRLLALLVGGVIWGLWHAPVILLGYNYRDPGPFGLVMMCGFTVLFGAVLCWLATSGRSVWPAVLGHSVINSMSSGILIVLSDRDHQPNVILGTPLGLIGWAVAAVIVVMALLTWPRTASAVSATAGPPAEPMTLR